MDNYYLLKYYLNLIVKNDNSNIKNNDLENYIKKIVDNIILDSKIITYNNLIDDTYIVIKEEKKETKEKPNSIIINFKNIDDRINYSFIILINLKLLVIIKI